MKILGMEKLSLVDYDGYISATLFLGGCNFRCPFCHNGPLVLDASNQPEIPLSEVLSYLEKRKNMLKGVCITGGEPTLYPDLEDLIKQIKQIGYSVKLDTNGTSPQTIKTLAEKKLIDYVAMDVKNCKEAYAKTVGLKSFDIAPIEESVSLLKSNVVNYEFRTTIVKEFHNDDCIEKIGLWLDGAEKYFLQAYKDGENCIETGLTKISEEVAKNYKNALLKRVKRVELRGY